MWFGVISLFPDMFQALHVGITGRALKEKLIRLHLCNPRDFATDKHKSVDDHPYGGGPGMVMMPEPLHAAIQAAKATWLQTTQAASQPNVSSTTFSAIDSVTSLTKPTTHHAPTVIYLSPQGKRFTQETAVELAAKKSVIFIAGRYEGIDERIIQQEVDEEWSIGDYILTGGELAAMAMIDAATRLLPGAVGDADSITQDSLTSGLLKYPQYTRPEQFNAISVPHVLLGGNHQQIRRWRLKASLGKTWLKRPDLLAKKVLTEEEEALLREFQDAFLKKPS